MSFGFAEKSHYQMSFGSGGIQPSAFFSQTSGNSKNIQDIHIGVFRCQAMQYVQSKGLYFAVCYDFVGYNGKHYSFSIPCPRLAFWRVFNDPEVMTFKCFCMYNALLFLQKLVSVNQPDSFCTQTLNKALKFIPPQITCTPHWVLLIICLVIKNPLKLNCSFAYHCVLHHKLLIENK